MRRLAVLAGVLLAFVALMFCTTAGLANNDDQEGDKGKGKGKGKKSEIVQVDLSQLPKELAKQLKDFLKGAKTDAKKEDGKKKKDDPKKKDEPKGKDLAKGKDMGKGKEASSLEQRLDRLSRELDEIRAMLKGKGKK